MSDRDASCQVGPRALSAAWATQAQGSPGVGKESSQCRKPAEEAVSRKGSASARASSAVRPLATERAASRSRQNRSELRISARKRLVWSRRIWKEPTGNQTGLTPPNSASVLSSELHPPGQGNIGHFQAVSEGISETLTTLKTRKPVSAHVQR